MADRFWEKVNKADSCWLWTGTRNYKGYGQVNLGTSENGRLGMAHRVSWELHFGPIPEGLLVCHSCDLNYPPGDITYRRCCNPAHLFVGTSKDNTEDMMKKGRGPHLTPLPGERNPNSKLTAEQVREIRQAHAAGVAIADIAQQYGTVTGNIGFIVNRQTWRHVP